MFTLGVLAVPIYVITGPVVLANDGPPTLSRVVTQPLVADADESSRSNAKPQAALKAKVERRQSLLKTQSRDRVSSGNAPAASPFAAYPIFAPL